MKEISFMVPVKPFPKGRPKFSSRNGFFRSYTPQKTHDKEAEFMKYAKQYCPSEPYEGAIDLTLVFMKVKPTGVRKSVIYWAKSPDLDNYIKLVSDSMNGHFYKDDGQVSKITAEKVYGEFDGIYVKIKFLE
jgi:Holliday junction resolvase RusA-like endonuclease